MSLTEWDIFDRKELLEEMQKATNYYKKSHSKNLSQTIKSMLIGDKFLEPSSGQFTLTAEEKSKLEKDLA